VIGRVLRSLAKLAAENGVTSTATSAGSKIGDAIGSRIGLRIHRPDDDDDQVERIAARVAELLKETK